MPFHLLIKIIPSTFSSVQFSHSVVSDSLPPHELQHTRPPCPSPTPRVHSDSRPSSRWCNPSISSSVVPFSSCPQSFPASESFPMSQLYRIDRYKLKWKSLAQSFPTLCDPIGYTVHGILQARILEWVASFSLLQGSFPTQGSNPGFPHCRRILYQLSHKGSHKGTDITGPISIS